MSLLLDILKEPMLLLLMAISVIYAAVGDMCITVAISFLSEDIPVAFTTFMALGAWKPIREGLTIKRSSSVDAPGSTRSFVPNWRCSFDGSDFGSVLGGV